MTTIILVLLLAAVLFFLEVILPGGVLGFFGGIMLIAAASVAYTEYGFVAGVLVFLLGVVIAVFFFFFQFKVLPRTRFGKRAFLNSTSEGTSNLPVGKTDSIGQTAIAISRLNPSGMVSVDGQRLQALSQTGYVEQGDTVEVVGRDSFRLLVRKK